VCGPWRTCSRSWAKSRIDTPTNESARAYLRRRRAAHCSVLYWETGPVREGRGVRRVWMGVLLRHDLQLHIVELVVAELERNEEREDVVGRCLKGTFPTQCRELSWCTFEDGGNDQVNGEGSQPCAGP
jgi:hypothetical protein